MTTRSIRFAACVMRALIAASIALAGALPAPALAVGEPGTPSRAYLDLRAAAEKATSAEAVVALLSRNYRSVVSGMQRGERDDWFQRLRRFPPGAVTIQAQTLAGDRCTIGAVARDAQRVKWSGRIEMVREGGAWKLDDERWTSDHR